MCCHGPRLQPRVANSQTMHWHARHGPRRRRRSMATRGLSRTLRADLAVRHWLNPPRRRSRACQFSNLAASRAPTPACKTCRTAARVSHAPCDAPPTAELLLLVAPVVICARPVGPWNIPSHQQRSHRSPSPSHSHSLRRPATSTSNASLRLLPTIPSPTRANAPYEA